jgi:hypothetical protein
VTEASGAYRAVETIVRNSSLWVSRRYDSNMR